MKFQKQATLFLTLLALVTLAAGCAETKRAKTVRESGLLEDYSRLRPGAKDEALLRYMNPAADLKKYDKVIIAPVQIFKPQEASEAEVADLQKLAQADEVQPPFPRSSRLARLVSSAALLPPLTGRHLAQARDVAQRRCTEYSAVLAAEL